MSPLPDLITYQDCEVLTPPDTESLWDESDEPDGPQGREYRDEATR